MDTWIHIVGDGGWSCVAVVAGQTRGVGGWEYAWHKQQTSND